MDPYTYPGEELSLFEEARNWKRYFGKKILPYIKGKVLEVGAGIGETTPYLFNDDVKEWTCLEPDSDCFAILSSKKEKNILPANCHIIQGMLQELPEGSKYDTILYIDVLEHIETDKSEIRYALEKLEPEGHLIIISPAYQFLYSPFDKSIGHYRRYTKKSLRETVAFPNLSEIKIFYLEVTGMLLLIFNKFLFRKKYPTGTVVKVWDRIFVPVSIFLDKVLAYSMGKSIIGIWKYKQEVNDTASL